MRQWSRWLSSTPRSIKPGSNQLVSWSFPELELVGAELPSVVEQLRANKALAQDTGGLGRSQQQTSLKTYGNKYTYET